MPIRPGAAPWRGAGNAVALAAILAVAAACSGLTDPTPTLTPAPVATPAEPTAPPTPMPTPPATLPPAPTPRFTNVPDPELAALFPEAVAGIPLIVAPTEAIALTPGDVGLAYGELGLRFASLVVAYVEQPRLTAYGVRVDGDPVATADLEPYLATAGRYVGIAGLDREAWQLATVAGNRVWTRPGDRANPAGTVIYTWAAGDLVFLLVGSDDRVNRALIEALPGEPEPTLAPSASPAGP